MANSENVSSRTIEPLYEQIYAAVRHIPYGKVSSYGEVAKGAGLFRGARIVGWALRNLPLGSNVPWQRVINQKGQISIINPKVTKAEQAQRLEEEGVTVIKENGWYVVSGDCWYFFN